MLTVFIVISTKHLYKFAWDNFKHRVQLNLLQIIDLCNSNNRRDVVRSYGSMETSRPDPSRSATTYLACFFFSNLTVVRRFFLLFTFLKCGIFEFVLFSCILECLFSLSFILVCVCRGRGVGRVRSIRIYCSDCLQK